MKQVFIKCFIFLGSSKTGKNDLTTLIIKIISVE